MSEPIRDADDRPIYSADERLLLLRRWCRNMWIGVPLMIFIVPMLILSLTAPEWFFGLVAKRSFVLEGAIHLSPLPLWVLAFVASVMLTGFSPDYDLGDCARVKTMRVVSLMWWGNGVLVYGVAMLGFYLGRSFQDVAEALLTLGVLGLCLVGVVLLIVVVPYWQSIFQRMEVKLLSHKTAMWIMLGIGSVAFVPSFIVLVLAATNGDPQALALSICILIGFSLTATAFISPIIFLFILIFKLWWACFKRWKECKHDLEQWAIHQLQQSDGVILAEDPSGIDVNEESRRDQS